ncbi:hypothetical protein SD71_08470 [Cohnella kolymensis]|uniref:DUF2232 domain-containing protein n=1 Tax=Cohnella kolymensis TaxID=1590652 RepID=A0ABR5A5I7_9BACL|nr:DUF2232 domain-containing protein [Cohnella kolymensis]KIL36296.1 hypothetical protein SD71_08470 [Cohnella kolymensis]
MKIGWKPLIWSAAALLLLLSIPTPFIVITMFMIMTPFVVLFTTLSPARFAAHVIAIAAAAFFLLGGYGPIALTIGLFFLVPSLAMGLFYKKGSPARTAILAGFVVILAQFLLELVLFSVQFDIDLSAELSGLLTTSLQQLGSDALLPQGWTVDMLSESFITWLPTVILFFAFLFAVITHGLSRLALRTAGFEAPALPPAKTWRLPRSLVFYYLVAIIASFVVPENGGYWEVVIANLLPILQFAFIIQAIGFFFFLADAKRWPSIAAVLLSVPLFLFPPLHLIGLIDAAYPLRRYFVKS